MTFLIIHIEYSYAKERLYRQLYNVQTSGVDHVWGIHICVFAGPRYDDLPALRPDSMGDELVGSFRGGVLRSSKGNREHKGELRGIAGNLQNTGKNI